MDPHPDYVRPVMPDLMPLLADTASERWHRCQSGGANVPAVAAEVTSIEHGAESYARTAGRDKALAHAPTSRLDGRPAAAAPAAQSASACCLPLTTVSPAATAATTPAAAAAAAASTATASTWRRELHALISNAAATRM